MAEQPIIVITGAAGFIGSALAWRLNQAGRTNLLLVDELGLGDKWKNLVPLAYRDYADKDDFLAAVRDGSLDGMGWQGSTAHAARFRAEGLEGAAFQELNVFDARAEVDIGALWDRVWRVNRISVARVEADFSPGRTAGPGDSPSSDETGAGGGQQAPGWLRRWLPNLQSTSLLIDGKEKAVRVCTRCLRTHRKAAAK